jgi:hypothetical protein
MLEEMLFTTQAYLVVTLFEPCQQDDTYNSYSSYVNVKFPRKYDINETHQSTTM